MDAFLDPDSFDTIFGFLGVIFGVISTIGYIDQLKANRKNKMIIKFINIHLDRDITQERIEELQDKKSELEVEVTEKIPNIGRMIILQDQLEFYK